MAQIFCPWRGKPKRLNDSSSEGGNKTHFSKSSLIKSFIRKIQLGKIKT